LKSPLILGAAGQLGSELARLLPQAPLYGVPIADPAAVDVVFAHRRPDVVFNCAAYNAVDQAEREPELAMASNADGPMVLAAACRRAGATLVHFSTNFVFDGALDRPYVESDEPAPLSAYARSKLAGEQRVLQSGAQALVIRTAALYGRHSGFPRRIERRAREGGKLDVVADQRVNPTFAADLAAVTVRLVEQGVLGIVHAVGGGCCGWDEFAAAVLEELGLENEVVPVATGRFPSLAVRPRNGCLESTRIPPLRPWREALREALNP
jgi:dTDP-4-dehydrorhamnose reductase